MANIEINDLTVSNELDRKALKSILGGISFGWLAVHQKDRRLMGASPIPGITYNDFSGATFMANPTFVINQDFSTNNQTQVTVVEVFETINSSVGINLGQGQVGLNGVL